MTTGHRIGVGVLLAGLGLCGCYTPVTECVPTTCTAEGKNCGPLSDRCSAVLDCGKCSAGSLCGAGGVENVCAVVPVPVCVPATNCAKFGAECGKVADGCGGELDCGGCLSPNVCGNVGAPNKCVCSKRTCASVGFNCGMVDDRCGGMLQCGNCTLPGTCGGGGVANTCGCTPTTCAALGAGCGNVPDGCGSILLCGTCNPGDTCGGGGIPNVCSCPAVTTCAAQGKNCGTIPDGCGSTLNCGTCPAPKTCGAAGVPNVCGCLTCASLGKNCGTVSDGCGNTLNCGTCTLPATCGGGVLPNVCSCPGVACDAPPVLTAVTGAAPWVELTWTDPSAAESGFALERSFDGGTFAPLVTAAANQINAVDGTPGPAQTFGYRVRATSALGPGPWSNVATVTLPAPVNAWRTLGGDVQHTGTNPAETGKPPLAAGWTASLGTGQLSPVVIEAGRVFVGARFPPQLTALDAATGTQAWSHPFPASSSVGQPAVFGGHVNVVHGSVNDTRMWSFDAATGMVGFSVLLNAQFDEFWAPIQLNTRLFTYGGTFGGMYSLDAATGASQFIGGLEQIDRWSPAADNSSVYSFVAGKLRQHSAATNLLNWTLTIPGTSGSGFASSPVLGAGYAFLIHPPTLFAVELRTHTVKWSATGLSFTGTPAYAAGKVYAISGGNIRVYDAFTGAFEWTFVGDSALSFPPVVVNGVLYASSNANAFAVDVTTHQQLWTTGSGGWLSIAGGRLYLAGSNGVLKTWTLSP